MKLGLSSYAYPWACGLTGQVTPPAIDAFELMARAHAWQLDAVQLCDWPLHEWPAAELVRLRAHADALGLAIELGTRGIAPVYLKQWIEVAEHLGARLLRTLLDSKEAEPTAEEAISTLRRVAPRLEEANVCLMIENHDRFPARTLKHIVERIGSAWVQVCFDTANSFGCWERPEEVLAVLGPHVVNVHVKDVWIHRFGHSSGFMIEGTAAGQGMLDLRGVLKQAQEFGRAPTVIIEHWVTAEPTVEATLAKEQRMVEESVAWLKRVFTGADTPL